eukprot:gene5107-226_t
MSKFKSLYSIVVFIYWPQVECRTSFVGRPPIKLFFDRPDEEDKEEYSNDPVFMKSKIKDLSSQLEEKDTKIKEEQGKVKASKKELKGVKSELNAVRDALDKSDSINNVLKKQLQFLDKHKEEAQRARETASVLQRNLDNLQNVEELIKGEKKDVDTLLRKFQHTPDALEQVVTSLVIMKKEFGKLRESKDKMSDERKSFRKEMDELRRKMQASLNDNMALKERLKLAECDMEHFEREKQRLLKKISHLEQAFASPSPRASAIKRLLKESPAPQSAKKMCPSFADATENYVDADENEDDAHYDADSNDCLSDSFNELANEIGLKIVNTTTISIQNKKQPFGKTNMNLKVPRTRPASTSSSSSSTSVIQKGFNGLGGQGRFIKKRISNKVKIPKTKVNNFFIPKANPKLPDFELSPE